MRITFFYSWVKQKRNFLAIFFNFSCKIIVLIFTYPIFCHKIMLTGFLSIINMGMDIKTRFLTALYAEILQKDWNAPKSRQPFLKMAPVGNEMQSRFSNCFFEIELPHTYFLNTKTINLLETVSFRFTFLIMIFTKTSNFSHFFKFSCKILVLISTYPTSFH